MWGDNLFRQVVYDMFGNLQWDRDTGFTVSVINGPLTINGGPLTVNGLTTLNGNTQINGSETVTGQVSANAVSAANLVGTNLVATTATITTLAVTSQATINDIRPDNNTQYVNIHGLFVRAALDGNPIALQSDGDMIVHSSHIRVQGRPTVSFSLEDQDTNIDWVMFQSTDGNISWGHGDGQGNPTNNLMYLTGNGDLIISNGLHLGTVQHSTGLVVDGGATCSFSGDIHPNSDGAASCGETGNAWANVVAHNFITASTDPTSPEVAVGMLPIVAGIPVKTLPHIGIAESDLNTLAGAQAQGGGGVNYSVLVGVLWQALKELNTKVDTYVAAHP